MKIFWPSLAAISLLCALASHSQAKKPQKANANGSVQQQVKMLNDQMIEASLKGNTSVLEKYYADDCLVIHGDGKVSTKAQEMEDFKSGAVKYDSLDVREQKILTYRDTGVANVLVSTKGTFHGKPLSSDVRATRVWVKQKGEWKNVLFQVTRVPSPSQ